MNTVPRYIVQHNGSSWVIRDLLSDIATVQPDLQTAFAKAQLLNEADFVISIENASNENRRAMV